jgi:hypothetical protein
MKFYCTKYWSTKGIIEFEGEVCQEVWAKEKRSAGSWGTLFVKIGRDAFTVLQSAQEDVEQKAHLNVHAKERALRVARARLQQAVDRKIKVVT